MLHWIFKSERVQDFVIGCMEGFYDKAVHDADKEVLSAYMERGDVSGLTWDLDDRLSWIAECIGDVESMRMRRTLEILRRAIEKELRWRDVDEAAKEAARPRDVNDLWDEIEDVRARLDGEVCEKAQPVLDTVHTLQQAIGNWIDEGRETEMSIALTSAMAVMVMAVDHGKVRYGRGLSPKYRLKDFQVEAVTEAACELAQWRREDMRRWPQLGWTEAKIETLKWKMLGGIKRLSFYRAHTCDQRLDGKRCDRDQLGKCKDTTCHNHRFPRLRHERKEVDWSKVDRREYAEPGICICGIPFGSVSSFTIDGSTGNLKRLPTPHWCCANYPRELARAIGAVGVNL